MPSKLETHIHSSSSRSRAKEKRSERPHRSGSDYKHERNKSSEHALRKTHNNNRSVYSSHHNESPTFNIQSSQDRHKSQDLLMKTSNLLEYYDSILHFSLNNISKLDNPGDAVTNSTPSIKPPGSSSIINESSRPDLSLPPKWLFQRKDSGTLTQTGYIKYSEEQSEQPHRSSKDLSKLFDTTENKQMSLSPKHLREQLPDPSSLNRLLSELNTASKETSDPPSMQNPHMHMSDFSPSLTGFKNSSLLSQLQVKSTHNGNKGRVEALISPGQNLERDVSRESNTLLNGPGKLELESLPKTKQIPIQKLTMNYTASPSFQPVSMKGRSNSDSLQQGSNNDTKSHNFSPAMSFMQPTQQIPQFSLPNSAVITGNQLEIRNGHIFSSIASNIAGTNSGGERNSRKTSSEPLVEKEEANCLHAEQGHQTNSDANIKPPNCNGNTNTPSSSDNWKLPTLQTNKAPSIEESNSNGGGGGGSQGFGAFNGASEGSSKATSRKNIILTKMPNNSK